MSQSHYSSGGSTGLANLLGVLAIVFCLIGVVCYAAVLVLALI